MSDDDTDSGEQQQYADPADELNEKDELIADLRAVVAALKVTAEGDARLIGASLKMKEWLRKAAARPLLQSEITAILDLLNDIDERGPAI